MYNMNVNVKTLYFLIKNGRVVLCESNLKDFLLCLPKDLKNIRQYDYYYRFFKKKDFFQSEFNKDYYFQKIEYNQ